MKLVYYYNLIRGKTNATHPAKLTLRNIYAVIQSFIRKKKKNMAGFELETYLYEQIIWRRTQVMDKSPRCWDEGVCTVCGCDILGKTMEDRACEGHCYPPMMNKESWEMYKKAFKIKLFE